jgi:hypothetical protein
MSDEGERSDIDFGAVNEVLDRVDKPPVLDSRSDDEIIGYNEFGLFDEEGDFSLTDVEVVELSSPRKGALIDRFVGQSDSVGNCGSRIFL